MASSSSSPASCKPGDSTVVEATAAAAVTPERHEEALERVRALEGTVERLQAENAALRVEPEWSSSGNMRSVSVQEEVSNVDVVRYILLPVSSTYIKHKIVRNLKTL